MASATDTPLETFVLKTTDDVIRSRQAVRRQSVELGFSIVDQTKLITAASELARNAVNHGQGGQMRIEVVGAGIRKGIRLSFEDQGPGIADVEQAMQDGYTTGGGLGHGLGGAKRLVNEFEIQSRVGEGTRVTITKRM